MFLANPKISCFYKQIQSSKIWGENSMKKKLFLLISKSACAILLTLCILFAMLPQAQASTDAILIRRYDISQIDQGIISLAITSENEINLGDMEIEIAGVKTMIDGNVETVPGQDFLYVLVMDESAPYYSRLTTRQRSHVLCLLEAARQVIEAADRNARFCFVWAGPYQGSTGIVDKEAAKLALEGQQSSMLANYKDGNTTANLLNALTAALQIAQSNPGKITSVLLFSDCGESVDNISAKYIEIGVPLYAWAIRQSKASNQGNSEAGRKSVQTESAKTGGAYEEWDLGAYASDGTEVSRVTIGRIGNALYYFENGTKNYASRFPESALEQARLSQNQLIQVKYRGNVLASRIATDLQLTLLPTPVASVTPKPSPTPRVIYFGDTASEVRTLQEILRAKGYYSGPISGKYEADTRAALQAIWRDNEGQDPESGYEAWNADLLTRLENYGVRETPKPKVIALSKGDQGEYVVKLQDKLYQLGYYHRLQRSANHSFDADTQEAVNRFCRENGISVPTSGCPKEVFERILAADEKTQQYNKPTLVELAVGEADQNGDHYIEALQNELHDKGYLGAGYQLGTMDALTIDAIQAICRENGWSVPEDVVSVEIQQRIKTANMKVTATPAVTATPRPDVIDLHMGDSGDYVVLLQNQLSNLGFYHRLKVDSGIFDQDTQEAVGRFCEQIGQARPDEGCSEQMFRLILGSTVKYKPPVFVELTLNEHDQDEDRYIETLQNELNEKGYLEAGYQLGVMDGKTMAAIQLICHENGWAMSGDTVTVELQQRIRTAAAKAVPTTPPAYKTLTLNDRDSSNESYIRALQDRLLELGYFEQTPTIGVYDELTAAAVSLFMQQNSLNGDGTTITAQQLENKLFGENHPRKKTLSEEFIQFVTSDVEILDYHLPMWSILAILAALVFTIVIVLIVAVQRKKQRSNISLQDGDSHVPSTVKEKRNRVTAESDQPTVSSDRASENQINSWGDNFNSVPAEQASFASTPTSYGSAEDAPTVNDSGFAGMDGGPMPLRFEISYGGATNVQTVFLSDRIRIGRNSKECDLALDPTDRSVSRVHCEIRRASGQVMVKNLSSSEAGTIVNGYRIASAASVASEDAATVNLDDFSVNEGETQLHSGDTLTIGRHTITVTY